MSRSCSLPASPEAEKDCIKWEVFNSWPSTNSNRVSIVDMVSQDIPFDVLTVGTNLTSSSWLNLTSTTESADSMSHYQLYIRSSSVGSTLAQGQANAHCSWRHFRVHWVGHLCHYVWTLPGSSTPTTKDWSGWVWPTGSLCNYRHRYSHCA
jgi:hypothetical protein